ncbi:acyltransferase [Erythrobacter sp. MTPC3]|uniref:acyltransferase n=1 Tax=Erythrobacter sp. MTPC3 TaxID=3056564 RepID=UPI0036F3D47C
MNASTQRLISRRRRSLRQHFDYLFRRFVWGTDIASSAWISPSAYIDRTYPKGVLIEEDCIIEDDACVLTHDMTRGLYLDTKIGAGSVIGTRAIIMPGITVGAGCIVDPGSVVLSDLPDGSHVRGSPAKPLGRTEA